jgi:hypothetical protein
MLYASTGDFQLGTPVPAVDYVVKEAIQLVLSFWYP